MKAIIWVSDDSWERTIDAALDVVPESAEVTLLCVIDAETPELAHGAFSGLLGRGRPDDDPGLAIEAELAEAAGDLLDRAAERFARPAERQVLSGWKVEHDVADLCAAADLLVLARDGEPDRVGPRSLGRAGRFVVDHAACRVLLIWSVPRSEISMRRPPPPPHGRPPHDRPPPKRPPHDRRPPPPHERGPSG
jgi:hypothetical protein